MKKTTELGSDRSTSRFKGRATRLLIAAGAALCLFAPPASANLLVNGGFEAGDFSGWDLTDPSGFSAVSCPGPGPSVAEGLCSAALGATGSDGTLSQDIATTAGQGYVLSFRFLWDGGTPADFIASINGNPVFTRVDPPAISHFGTARIDFFATGALSTISFAFRDDPGFIFLDAVAVDVPEPGSAALIAIALAGLALARRRRT